MTTLACHKTFGFLVTKKIGTKLGFIDPKYTLVIHVNTTFTNNDHGTYEGHSKVCHESISQGNEFHPNEIPTNIFVDEYSIVCDKLKRNTILVFVMCIPLEAIIKS